MQNKMNDFDGLPVVESDVRKVGFDEKISEIMGDRYKEWEKKELIFIQASTGLGKSYAILHYLYQYVLEQKEEMAVLVNRRILKEQQWQDVRKYDLEMNHREVQLHLFSYHELEGSGQQAGRKREILKRCRYIVCDECHYFLLDSVFNPRVQTSFDYITSLYECATLVFISATLDCIRPLVKARVLYLHKHLIQECESKKSDYDDRIYEKYLRKKNSEILAAMKLEEKKKSREYQADMTEYNARMTLPQIREYQFFRDLSGNTVIKFFRDFNDLIDLIERGIYVGKWLIFVSSKKIGKKIRGQLTESLQDKAVVYIDADYDNSFLENPYQMEAKKEVNYIEKTGRFNCDVLIATAVLDNGINIRDENLKNMVLVTDNEEEFKQMFGRKRFLKTDEMLNLFIFSGNASMFKKWANSYFELYWQLCDNRDIDLSNAQERLLAEPNKMAHFFNSYYDFDGCRYHSNELTIEAVRMRYLHCRKVYEGLERDKYFFIKEQMEWLGTHYTSDGLENASISFSQTDLEKIQLLLNDFDQMGGILSKEQFKEFGKVLMQVAAKIAPKDFVGKKGSKEIVNRALMLRDEWKEYSFVSVGDDKKYYEMLINGTTCQKLRFGLTYPRLKQLVSEAEMDLREIYPKLFETPLPLALENDIDTLKIFINAKLKNYPGLEGWILKSSGNDGNKKVIVGKRPASVTE